MTGLKQFLIFLFVVLFFLSATVPVFALSDYSRRHDDDGDGDDHRHSRIEQDG